METIVDQDESGRLLIYICDNCDQIHIASYDSDGINTGQVLVAPDDLNGFIVELMKIRDKIA